MKRVSEFVAGLTALGLVLAFIKYNVKVLSAISERTTSKIDNATILQGALYISATFLSACALVLIISLFILTSRFFYLGFYFEPRHEDGMAGWVVRKSIIIIACMLSLAVFVGFTVGVLRTLP